jgi:2,3-dihydroxyphenylpropionate 1,2-dioxygenase
LGAGRRAQGERNDESHSLGEKAVRQYPHTHHGHLDRFAAEITTAVVGARFGEALLHDTGGLMSKVVLGIGASHTTLMNTQWNRVDHLPRAHQFREALRQASEALNRSRPDAVIIVGSNHFRGFWLDLMPPFTVGVGEVVSSGEHGTPAGELPTDASLGQHICNVLTENEFDVAFSTRLTVDHGISHAFQWIVEPLGIPIVPIVINCFAPPLPSLKRTRAFGEALGSALRGAPGRERIAIIGTGGLSHQLPFPDWRSPVTEEDAYLVHSWRAGRGRWQEFEPRRREIVLKAAPRLNEKFDREFLQLIEQGRVADVPTRFSDSQLTSIAGNGAAEIRTWQIMAAALENRPGRVLAYSAMPEWLTGMAVAVIPNDSAACGEHA